MKFVTRTLYRVTNIPEDAWLLSQLDADRAAEEFENWFPEEVTIP